MTIEDRAKPAVLLCTDVFLETALAHAARLGIPDLAVVAIPNPLSGISADEVRGRAAAAASAVAQALVRA